MMRPTLSILLILLVLITPVTAAILTTPPMVTAGGREFSCTVVNVTELPVGLEVELRGTDGSVGRARATDEAAEWDRELGWSCRHRPAD